MSYGTTYNISACYIRMTDRTAGSFDLIENHVCDVNIFCSELLMTEINMSITKAFEEGQEAAELGKSKTDCPHQTDSQEGKDWHEGFDDRNATNDM